MLRRTKEERKAIGASLGVLAHSVAEPRDLKTLAMNSRSTVLGGRPQAATDQGSGQGSQGTLHPPLPFFCSVPTFSSNASLEVIIRKDKLSKQARSCQRFGAPGKPGTQYGLPSKEMDFYSSIYMQPLGPEWSTFLGASLSPARSRKASMQANMQTTKKDEGSRQARKTAPSRPPSSSGIACTCLHNSRIHTCRFGVKKYFSPSKV